MEDDTCCYNIVYMRNNRLERRMYPDRNSVEDFISHESLSKPRNLLMDVKENGDFFIIYGRSVKVRTNRFIIED